MSVSDGEKVNAAITNAAYLSRKTDSNTVAKIDLDNTDPNSGGSIANIQREHNSIASFVGKATNDVEGALPVWASDVIGIANQAVKVRVDAVQAQVELNIIELQNLRLTTGTSNGDQDMGIYTGSLLTDNLSQAALNQELENLIQANIDNIAANDGDIDDIRSAVGIADGDTDMGAYTGSFLTDNTNQKALNQELETEVDLKEDAANKDVPNGYCPLDGSGLVPAANLPSYVDDVLEYANLAAFPVTGETGKIYVALDTNFMYRWSGATYIDITSKVDSVNGQTGVVVLDADDIDDAATTHKFASQAQLDKVDHLTVTQPVDLDQMETDIGDNQTAIALNTAKVSADGSIDTHSDVDTTTTSPATDQVLAWDGANWVPTDQTGGTGGGTVVSGEGGINYITNSGAEDDLAGWSEYHDDTAEPVNGEGGAGTSQISQLTDNANLGLSSGYSGAQTFTTTGAFDLKTVNLLCANNGGSGTVDIHIWGVDGGGLPDSGNVLGSITNIDVTAWSAFPTTAVESFVFGTAISLAAATQYALVVDITNLTSNIVLRMHNTNPYAGGKEYTGLNLSSWTADNGGNNDIYFDLYDEASGLIPLSRTTNAANKLIGDASFLLSRPASDTQGSGAKSDFVIDSRFKNSKLTVKFDYKMLDANYTDGDYRVYIYDIDNTTLIGSVTNDDSGGILNHEGDGTTFIGQFYATDSLNYRLLVHNRVTDAVATLMSFDRVKVSPDEFLVASQVVEQFQAQGQVTNSFSSTSFAYNKLFYPTVISDENGRYNPANGEYTVGVDGFYKIKGAINVILGSNLASSAPIILGVMVNSSDTKVLENQVGANVENNYQLQGGTDLYLNKGDIINLFQRKSGTQTVTATGDTRGNYFSIECIKRGAIVSGTDVNLSQSKVRAYMGSNQVVATGAAATIICDVVQDQSGGLNYNPTTGVFTAPKNGWYNVQAQIYTDAFAATATLELNLYHNVNGIARARETSTLTSNSRTLDASTIIYLEKGDTTHAEFFHNTGSNRSLIAGSVTNFTVHELPDYSVFGIIPDKPSAIMTNAKSFTPVWTTNSGTLPPASTETASWWREGEFMMIRFFRFLTGAGTGGGAHLLEIPDGYLPDTAFYTGAGGSGSQGQTGGGSWYDGGTNRSLTSYFIDTQRIAILGNDGGLNGYNTDFANGDRISGLLKVKIIGWQATNLLTDGEKHVQIVKARYTNESHSSVPNAAITIAEYETKVYDTHGAVTVGAGTWKFTAPKRAYYKVNAWGIFQSTTWGTSDLASMYVFVNGSVFRQIERKSGVSGVIYNNIRGESIVLLEKGDYLDVRVYQNTGGALDWFGSQGHIDVEEIADFSTFGVVPDKPSAIMTGWESFTPTITGLGSGSGTVSGRYRRVGDSAEVMINFLKDGTAGTGTTPVEFGLPASLTADNTKVPFSGAPRNLGSLVSYNVDEASIYYTSSVILNGNVVRGIDSNTGSVLNGADFRAAGQYALNFSVPIEGWQSTNLLSSAETSFSTVDVRGDSNGATVLSANVTDIDFTEVADSHGAWDGSVFTAPKSGKYEFEGIAAFTASFSSFLFGYINGTSDKMMGIGTGDSRCSFQGEFYLNAGDTFSIRSNGAATLAAVSTWHWISISSLQDFSTFGVYSEHEYIEAELGSDYSVTAGNTWEYTGVSIPLASGEWDVRYMAAFRAIMTASTDAVNFKLELASGGSLDDTIGLFLDNESRVGVAHAGTLTGFGNIILPSSDTLKLYVRGVGAAVTVRATNITTALTDPDLVTKIAARRIK